MSKDTIVVTDGEVLDLPSEALIDEEQIEIPVTVETRVTEWLDRVNNDQLEPTMYIYRIVKDRRHACGKYTGVDIPDEHTIGMMLGSGEYHAVLQIPKHGKVPKKSTSFKFFIDPHYDQLRRDEAQNGNIGLMVNRTGMNSPYPHINHVGIPSAAPASQGQDTNAIEYFKEAVQMVTKMMGSMQQPQNLNTPDMGAVMLQQYQNMGELMKSNMLSTNNMMVNMLKDGYLNSGNLPSGENTEEENIVQKLIPKVMEFLPALLSNPATGAILSSLLKGVVSKPPIPKKPYVPPSGKKVLSDEEKIRRKVMLDRIRIKAVEDYKKSLEPQVEEIPISKTTCKVEDVEQVVKDGI